MSHVCLSRAEPSLVCVYVIVLSILGARSLTVNQTTSSCFSTEVGRVAFFLSALNTAEGQSLRIFLALPPQKPLIHYGLESGGKVVSHKEFSKLVTRVTKNQVYLCSCHNVTFCLQFLNGARLYTEPLASAFGRLRY